MGGVGVTLEKVVWTLGGGRCVGRRTLWRFLPSTCRCHLPHMILRSGLAAEKMACSRGFRTIPTLAASCGGPHWIITTGRSRWGRTERSSRRNPRGQPQGDDGRVVAAGSDSISKYVHPETMALPICLPGTIISLVRGCGCAPLRLTHTHLHCRYARLSGPRGMTTATAVSAQNPISPPSANATKRDG
jgi:hypothetical protein